MVSAYQFHPINSDGQPGQVSMYNQMGVFIADGR